MPALSQSLSLRFALSRLLELPRDWGQDGFFSRTHTPRERFRGHRNVVIGTTQVMRVEDSIKMVHYSSFLLKP